MTSTESRTKGGKEKPQMGSRIEEDREKKRKSKKSKRRRMILQCRERLGYLKEGSGRHTHQKGRRKKRGMGNKT